MKTGRKKKERRKTKTTKTMGRFLELPDRSRPAAGMRASEPGSDFVGVALGSAMTAVPYLARSPRTALFYLYLVWRSRVEGWNVVQVSHLDIAAALRMWPSTIRTARRKLESLGLVRGMGHGSRKAETYLVNLPLDVRGPWGKVASISRSDLAGERLCEDPLSRLSEDGWRMIRMLKDGMSPSELAVYGNRAARALRMEARGPVTEEAVELRINELVLLERIGRDRLRELGVLKAI